MVSKQAIQAVKAPTVRIERSSLKSDPVSRLEMAFSFMAVLIAQLPNPSSLVVTRDGKN